jgi:hypothetical protein
VGGNAAFPYVEWHLYREDCLNEVNGLITADKRNKIWVQLPSANGLYRLYVYMDDGKGNTVTASIPVVPFKGFYNGGP